MKLLNIKIKREANQIDQPPGQTNALKLIMTRKDHMSP